MKPVPMMPERSWFDTTVSLCSGVDDVLGDPPGIGHDGQRRVGAGAGRERAAIDHVKIVDLVRPAPAVENRRGRIVTHPGRAVLVRTVAGDPVDIDFLNILGPGGVEDLGVAVNQIPAHR